MEEIQTRRQMNALELIALAVVSLVLGIAIGRALARIFI